MEGTQQQKQDVAASRETSPSGDNLQTDQWGCTHQKMENLSYKWTITNFSFCTHSTLSPVFSARPTDTVQWQLELCMPSRGYQSDQVILIFKLLGNEKTDVTATWKCAVIDSESRKGHEKKVDRPERFGRGQSTSSSTCLFANKNVLWNNKNGFLPNDTLTIWCELKYTTGAFTLSGPTVPMKSECRLIHDMESLFMTEILSDVELIVENEGLRAHKAILAARSPVFLAMFQNNMKERNKNRVNIIEFGYEAIKEMLRFIYTGVVDDLKNIASELLKVADKYDIEDLKVTCEEALYSNLGVENAVDTMILADDYGAKHLKTEVVKYINAHGPEMMRNARFRSELASHEGMTVDVVIERFLALLEGPENEYYLMK